MNHTHDNNMATTCYCLGGFGLGTAPLVPLLTQLQRLGVRCHILPLPDAEPLADYLSHTASMLTAADVVLGWSFGGQIATLLVQQSGSRLITLASNPKFIATADWRHGMDEARFAAFVQQQQHSPQHNLHQFAALCGLQDADEHTRHTVKQLRRQLNTPTASTAKLHRLHLHWLAHLDTRAVLRQLAAPQLHFFGANDAVVPISVADSVHDMPTAHIVRVAGASHLLPLSQAQYCADTIARFLQTTHAPA